MMLLNQWSRITGVMFKHSLYDSKEYVIWKKLRLKRKIFVILTQIVKTLKSEVFREGKWDLWVEFYGYPTHPLLLHFQKQIFRCEVWLHPFFRKNAKVSKIFRKVRKYSKKQYNLNFHMKLIENKSPIIYFFINSFTIKQKFPFKYAIKCEF